MKMSYFNKILLSIVLFLSTNFTHEASETKLVCYYTNWAQHRSNIGRFIPENIDPHLCTHLVFAFGKISNNLIVESESNDKEMYERIISLKDKNPKLKILLSIGGWNAGSEMFSKLVHDADQRIRFVSNAIKYLKNYHFDGLDIDWEYPATREGSQRSDKELFTVFIQELKEELSSEKLLLTAMFGVGKTIVENGYELKKLANHLDWMNLMTYDLHGSWQRFSGHIAPLLKRVDEANNEKYSNIHWSVQNFIENGVPSEKLVLGISAYGRSFKLSEPNKTNPGAPTNDHGTPGIWTKEPGFYSYYEVCEKISNGWTKKWNPEQLSPYAFSNREWVGYEDDQSVAHKAEYIKHYRLGGAMFFALDLDDFTGHFCKNGKYPLLNTIKKSLFENKTRSLREIEFSKSDNYNEEQERGKSEENEKTYEPEDIEEDDDNEYENFKKEEREKDDHNEYEDHKNEEYENHKYEDYKKSKPDIDKDYKNEERDKDIRKEYEDGKDDHKDYENREHKKIENDNNKEYESHKSKERENDDNKVKHGDYENRKPDYRKEDNDKEYDSKNEARDKDIRKENEDEKDDKKNKTHDSNDYKDRKNEENEKIDHKEHENYTKEDGEKDNNKKYETNKKEESKIEKQDENRKGEEHEKRKPEYRKEDNENEDQDKEVRKEYEDRKDNKEHRKDDLNEFDYRKNEEENNKKYDNRIDENYERYEPNHHRNDNYKEFEEKKYARNDGKDYERHEPEYRENKDDDDNDKRYEDHKDGRNEYENRKNEEYERENLKSIYRQHIRKICKNGDGLYPAYDRNCKIFIQCEYSNTGLAKIHYHHCPKGTRFDPSIHVCNFAELVKCNY